MAFLNLRKIIDTTSIYSLYACYASGFEAMTYGAIVTFLGWTLYGFASDKFDLEKAKEDNSKIA